MALEDDSAQALLRLKRAAGQLNAVVKMVEEGRECAEVVTQLAAVSKAVNRAGFMIIAQGMAQCLREDPSGESVDSRKLQKLLLSLA